jgi:hypothetical protein
MALAVPRRNFAPFEPVQVESRRHLVFSQDPATNTCLDPDESIQHRHNKFFAIQFNIIFPTKSAM